MMRNGSLGFWAPAHRTVLLTETAVHWRATGLQIRLCLQPDEPRLIRRYLMLAQSLYAHSLTTPWDIAELSARLLLDTAADRVLPMHWRHLCIDHLYRPFADLARLADSDRRSRQLAELRRCFVRLDLDPRNSLYPGSEEGLSAQD